MIIEAARHLKVYDAYKVMRWTPKEFNLYIKGSLYRQVDEYEFMANQAMAHAKAANSRKRITAKNIFDGEKARRKIDKGFGDWKHSKRPNQSALKKLTNAFKGFKPEFKQKGG